MSQHSSPIKVEKKRSLAARAGDAINLVGSLLKSLVDIIKDLISSLPAILAELNSRDRLLVVLLFLIILSIPIVFIVVPVFVASLAIVNSVTTTSWSDIVLILERFFVYLIGFVIVMALIVLGLLVWLHKTRRPSRPELNEAFNDLTVTTEFTKAYSELSEKNRGFLNDNDLRPIVATLISTERGVISKDAMIRVLMQRLGSNEDTVRKKISKIISSEGNDFLEEDAGKKLLRIKNGIKKEELYAIWHINSERLDERVNKRVASLVEKGAPLSGANWWEMPWTDVLILESKICNKESLKKTIEDLLSTTKDGVYLYQVHLAFTLVASLFSHVKILDGVFQRLRDYHVKIKGRPSKR